ncbi:MAG: carboxylesterase/lipase family protein [Firmicutes bacterium]|nr:carboxylesterase/lipase family protein [Bacillota bacterium]
METTVETRYGAVRGYEADGVKVWKGIPYAQPPTGSLRFQAPRAPDPWTGVRDAREFGPMAVQPAEPGFFGRLPQPAQSEDCLTLNIWAPAQGDPPWPVMVWIHGGAFVTGSGSAPWYDGTSLARDGQIVVVTINYRLGPLGFLYLGELGGSAYRGSGNAGLLDQVQALQWVRENIGAFGGDPQRVTVAGESAGSMSVGTLLVMPAAQGLFRQAIMESGVPAFKTAAAASRVTQALLDRLHLLKPSVEALQAVPAAELLDAARDIKGDGVLPWAPVIDELTLQKPFWTAIGQAWGRAIPLLMGSNRDELWLWGATNPGWRMLADRVMLDTFELGWGPINPAVRDFYLSGKTGDALFEALMELGTHYAFWYPTQRLAGLHSAAAPTWVYRFDWQSTAQNGLLRACHALEIPFVFNTLDQPGVVNVTGDDPSRHRVAEMVQRAWLAFIAHGDPNGGSLPPWPPYDTAHRPVMVIDRESRVAWDPDSAARQLWDAVTRETDSAGLA